MLNTHTSLVAIMLQKQLYHCSIQVILVNALLKTPPVPISHAVNQDLPRNSGSIMNL